MVLLHWLLDKCDLIPRTAGKRQDRPRQLSPAREGRRAGGSVPPILPTTHPDHRQSLDRTWIHTGSTVGPGEVRFSQFPVLL